MKPGTRPHLSPGGPRRNERQERERAGLQGGAESRRKESREAGEGGGPGLAASPPGAWVVLGDARVYLKVSVLVEAGEAVRHLAALTPPQDDALRFAPPLSVSTPPPTPTGRAQQAGGGGEDVCVRREGVGKEGTGMRSDGNPEGAGALQAWGRNLPLTPLGFTPGPERPQRAAHARSRRRAASASGGKDQQGFWGLGSSHWLPCSVEESFFLMLLFTVKHILDL